MERGVGAKNAAPESGLSLGTREKSRASQGMTESTKRLKDVLSKSRHPCTTGCLRS